MTLLELITDAAEDTNNPSAINQLTKTRLTRYINEGLRRVLAQPGVMAAIDTDVPYALTSVADRARYAVSDSLAEIRVITERTNQTRLKLMTLEDYRRIAPDPSVVTGTPEWYVPIGRVSVQTVPSAEVEIFIKSTSGLDTKTAFIDGRISGGYPAHASVTMTGTTAVSFGNSFDDVSDVYLTEPARGVVTIHETSGSGTELARIGIGQQRGRYLGFYLFPTPSDAITYYIEGRKKTSDLVQDQDEPPWDDEFHWVLSAYARMRQYEKTDDGRYTAAKADWEAGKEQLRKHLLFPPGYRPVAGVIEDRGSNLGSWYPSGRW